MSEFISRSAEETYQIGQTLAKHFKLGDVLLFQGTLGAGKTTLIQGLIHALTGKKHEVVSPTFIYVNVYEGDNLVCHFDLYRLESDGEFYARAFDEYLDPKAIVCLEWPERVPSLKGSHTIRLSHLNETMRKIEVNQL